MRTIIITDQWIDKPKYKTIPEVFLSLRQDDVLKDLYLTVPFAIGNHHFLKISDDDPVYHLIIQFEDSDYIPEYLHKYIIKPPRKSET